ncbi:flagellar basal body rod protein FlgB [Acidihalobacter ferrooxydans]|uniref:Flagellar basal body rod protein FlgB n=1 Tax=Acidihalobacter ferrooxydans TaxID=1765967 RepID=A0A1P8UGK7_9GAMM|nr:flagellar basal body rod protein FlgB [Acidihalobacter ferrooxydans]APZ42983.1 flagellar basal-body rod protein FlgB [Acidihalobacter ferrooxydans]
MPFSINQALGPFPQILQLEAKRAQLLASNIANADTPNYKARDLDFKAAMQAIEGKQSHLPLAPPAAGPTLQPTGSVSQPVTMYQVPLQPSLDGNTVDLQRNEAQFGENALRYQATLTFLGSRISGLRKALTGQ